MSYWIVLHLFTLLSSSFLALHIFNFLNNFQGYMLLTLVYPFFIAPFIAMYNMTIRVHHKYETNTFTLIKNAITVQPNRYKLLYYAEIFGHTAAWYIVRQLWTGSYPYHTGSQQAINSYNNDKSVCSACFFLQHGKINIPNPDQYNMIIITEVWTPFSEHAAVSLRPRSYRRSRYQNTGVN